MKASYSKVRIFTVVFIAVGWWGLLYPELIITPDMVKVVEQTDCSQTEGESLYLELLRAKPGQIKFRSRLLAELNAFWETKSWNRSTKN